jgi:hypothetical protein
LLASAPLLLLLPPLREAEESPSAPARLSLARRRTVSVLAATVVAFVPPMRTSGKMNFLLMSAMLRAMELLLSEITTADDFLAARAWRV